ncbi:GH10225 [Drosophila grimshawi]|uniref:GH10225 n=2 Tax=Drosophila grimshawi TaxID=7222 RepID=B4JBF5_DROGR|nr:GH10225 [Drosophila grimshawi]
MDENKSFRCSEDGCGKAFWFKAALKRHMNTHKEVDPDEPTISWGCSECCKVFAKVETLRRHYKTSHGSVQIYTCEVPDCNQMFQRKDNLTRHAASHGDNKHSCETCGKSFARKDALTRHKT